MKILKLHNPTGHPYWQADEYGIELPDGTFYDKSQHHPGFGGGHKIKVQPDGIYYQQCYSSSGGGKTEATDRFPAVLIVSKNQYDKIEYVGAKLEMSETLKNDLIENNISPE